MWSFFKDLTLHVTGRFLFQLSSLAFASFLCPFSSSFFPDSIGTGDFLETPPFSLGTMGYALSGQLLGFSIRSFGPDGIIVSRG